MIDFGIKKGMRVRVLNLQGCQATVRHNEREGTVTGFRCVGAPPENEYAVIQLDSGPEINRAIAPRLWNMYNGLPEYVD